MNGESPEPIRPLVATLHKGPFFYLRQAKKTAG
ncbi:MAG: hypothetical protein ACRC2A_16025 [Enterobacterales bacterium]